MYEQQVVLSERAQSEYSGILGDSEDSDEEPILEPLLGPSWEELPILERFGLSSCEEMTEEEIECAFAQFVMAFQCDQYTLTQRLRAEEHDRSIALENLQLELQNTRDTLQMLCERMSGAKVRERVKQIEANLQTMENSMENIITTAETLGASHQEARMAHAVELMALHVEKLKMRHSVENTELLHTRKLLQRTRGRLLSDSTEDGELKQLVDSRQHVTRRRVSITLIPTQAQMTDLEVKFLESCRSGEEPNSPNQEELKSTPRCVVLPRDGSTDHSDAPEEDPGFYDLRGSQQVNVRHRVLPPALLKPDQNSEEGEPSMAEWSQDPTDIVQSEARMLIVLLVLCGILLLVLLYLRAPLHRRR